MLVKQLGIDENQATGGAGLLLKTVQDKLDTNEFAQIADKIPNVQSLIQAAPNVEAGSGGGLMGSIGGMLGGLGGDKAQALGDLANLTSGFEKLGLDSNMVSQFVPVIVQFVKEKGGDNLVGLLQKVIPNI